MRIKRADESIITFAFSSLEKVSWACAKKRTQVKRDIERQSNYEYTCDPIQEHP